MKHLYCQGTRLTVMLATGIPIGEKEEDPAKRYIGINIFPRRRERRMNRQPYKSGSQHERRRASRQEGRSAASPA